MITFLSLIAVSLAGATSYPADCKTEINLNSQVCEVLTVEGLSDLLNVEETAYTNPTSLMSVSYVSVISESQDTVELSVEINSQTIYIEDGGATEAFTDICDVRLEKMSGSWQPVYAYCYEQDQTFGNY